MNKTAEQAIGLGILCSAVGVAGYFGGGWLALVTFGVIAVFAGVAAKT